MAEHHNPLLDHDLSSDADWHSSRPRSWWRENEKEHPEIHQRAVESMRRHVAGAHLAVSLEEPALHKVLDDGAIRPAFVTNTTSVFGGDVRGYLDERQRVEHMHFGYPHQHPDAARPVYGYLTHHPLTDAGTGRYGAHTLVLSRPALAHRTTWNLGDSLNSADRIRPSHLTDPRIDSIAHTQMGGSLPGNRYRPADQRVRMTLKAPADYSDDGYLEAQIHGGLPLRHVHYAVLRSFDPADRQRTRQLAQRLSQAGIPWIHTTGWASASRALESDTAARAHVAVATGALCAPHHDEIRWHDGGRRYIVGLVRPGRCGLAAAQIADVGRGVLHPPQPIDSILARGYWHQLDHPMDTADVLSLVRPAGV